MNNYIDIKILSIYITFGFLVIFAYLLLLKNGNYSKLWSNNGRNMLQKYRKIKYVYSTMICLSLVAGIYLVYYLSTILKDDMSEILIYIGSVLFLVFSTLWAFFPFYYSKIVLFIVFVGSVLILAGISVGISVIKPVDIVALISIIIIVIQTGFFDLGLWNGLIPFNKV